MRRVLALIAVLVLVPLSAMGCRHVAGECDCAHAASAGAPAVVNAPPASIPAPGVPAVMPK